MTHRSAHFWCLSKFVSNSSRGSRCRYPRVVWLYPERRVHPEGAVPVPRGRRVSFVTRAGHGGSAGSRVAAAAASSPASFGCPAGQPSLPAWLPLPQAFPLLLGEGGRREGVSLLAFLLLSACSRGSLCHSQVSLFPPQTGSTGVSRDGRVEQTPAWLSFLAQHPSVLGWGFPGNMEFNSSPLLFSGVRLCSVLQHWHPNHAGKGDSRVTPQCRAQHRHREFSSRAAVTSWQGLQVSFSPAFIQTLQVLGWAF